MKFISGIKVEVVNCPSCGEYVHNFEIGCTGKVTGSKVTKAGKRIYYVSNEDLQQLVRESDLKFAE